MNVCVCNTWDCYSVTTAHVDLCISNNGTWQDAFQFGKEGDTTWTLDGQDFELDVQLTPYDAASLITLSTQNGRIIIDDTIQRVIHFSVPAADIQTALTPGIYVYDLVMVSLSNERVPLMYGTLQVQQGVTYTP